MLRKDCICPVGGSHGDCPLHGLPGKDCICPYKDSPETPWKVNSNCPVHGELVQRVEQILVGLDMLFPYGRAEQLDTKWAVALQRAKPVLMSLIKDQQRKVLEPLKKLMVDAYPKVTGHDNRGELLAMVEEAGQLLDNLERTIDLELSRLEQNG